MTASVMMSISEGYALPRSWFLNFRRWNITNLTIWIILWASFSPAETLPTKLGEQTQSDDPVQACCFVFTPLLTCSNSVAGRLWSSPDPVPHLSGGL